MLAVAGIYICGVLIGVFVTLAVLWMFISK